MSKRGERKKKKYKARLKEIKETAAVMNELGGSGALFQREAVKRLHKKMQKRGGKSDFVRAYTKEQAENEVARLIEDGVGKDEIEVYGAAQLEFSVEMTTPKITINDTAAGGLKAGDS